MPSQGPRFPTTAADDAGVGTEVWNSPTDALTDDGVNAFTLISDAQISHYLLLTNYGFTIPAGSTIDGITVVAGILDTNNLALDNRVRIVKGGTIGATDRSNSGVWPTTETARTYGSGTDLWGETWTSTDINATGFGVALSAKVNGASGASQPEVDYIKITVFYTEAAAGHPAIRRFNQTRFMRPVEIGREGVMVA